MSFILRKLSEKSVETFYFSAVFLSCSYNGCMLFEYFPYFLFGPVLVTESSYSDNHVEYNWGKSLNGNFPLLYLLFDSDEALTHASTAISVLGTV